MVAAVQRGRSLRSVARKFRVTLATVQKWVRRADGQRLDRVNWTDAPRGGRRTARATSRRTEDLILRVRRQLKLSSDLGEFGAAAIHRALAERGVKRIPTIRTIGRILLRRGALDGRQRIRRPPPPKGWYLPRVAAPEGGARQLRFRGRARHPGWHRGHGAQRHQSAWWSLWKLGAIHLEAKFTVETLIAHWREHGLPEYAQFDNDTIFLGNRMYRDAFGRVIRLCLQLGITPVFTPLKETGFQAAIENYNGRWQAKVWSRLNTKISTPSR